MATTRFTLTRLGRVLGPLDMVTLDNGTALPVGVYHALCDAYVRMMRQTGVLNARGEVDPSALLDTASIGQTQDAARRESFAAPRPGPRVAARPPSTTPASRDAVRPPVPVSEIVSFEGRYNRAFGDRRWMQVAVDARSSADGSGSGGHLGAEVALGVALPGMGAMEILKEEIDVAVLWDICTARTAIDAVGPDLRVAASAADLRNVAPWQSRRPLGRMYVLAFGLPVNVLVDVVGVAGISCQGTARSAFDDPRASQGILEATIAPRRTAAGDSAMQGAFARLWLEGSTHVDLSLRSMVGLLSEFDPGLRRTIVDVLSQMRALDPWGRNVGSMGASISVQLASLQLRAEGFYGLDFDPNRRGRDTARTDRYVHAGSIDARLSARLLADPSIQVFAGLARPVGVDVHWEEPSLERAWPRLGDRHEVWGWRGPLFDREVSILQEEWKVELGTGGRPVLELPMEAMNGA
jgi:hypothetical protein